MLTPKLQFEYLDSLLHTEAWTEFLEPSFKAMSEALINQAKAAKDPHEVSKLLGQAIGVDVILQLPQLRDILKVQLEETPDEGPQLSLVE